MTYPQQGGPPQQGGYGPPGYPQPGGYGPHPPKKPNTGLIVGIVSAVVVVVLGLVLVLVLTGGDDDKSPGTAGGGVGEPPDIPDPTLTAPGAGAPGAGAPGAGAPGGGADDGPADGPGSGSDGGGSGGPSGSADPWDLVQSMARIFETHDIDAFEDYACGNADLIYFQKDLEQLEGMQVTAEAKDINETSSTEADATIAIGIDSQGQDAYAIKLEKQNGVWCAHHRWAAEN